MAETTTKTVDLWALGHTRCRDNRRMFIRNHIHRCAQNTQPALETDLFDAEKTRDERVRQCCGHPAVVLRAQRRRRTPSIHSVRRPSRRLKLTLTGSMQSREDIFESPCCVSHQCVPDAPHTIRTCVGTAHTTSQGAEHAPQSLFAVFFALSLLPTLSFM